MGYTAEKLRTLPEEILPLMTDPYERFALEHNMKLVLRHFGRPDALRFLVRCPASFTKNTDTFQRRLNDVILRMGEDDWKQLILEQFSQCPNDCIICAIGANDEHTWECALDWIKLFREEMWL